MQRYSLGFFKAESKRSTKHFMFFSTPTQEKRLAPLIDAIQKKNKKVTFFLGAGISTSCGIPDFRSPETGLYSNLEKLNLPYPEAVFDIDYFRSNPKAFYTLCDELYPGKFVPSKFHFLVRLFQDNDKLKRVYTQNIDTLERIAGVDEKYIVEAHGSFASNHCIDCHEEVPSDILKKQMADKHTNEGIPKCSKCKGYIKPDITFFGEGLPEKFFYSWHEDSDDVEVAIVAGTSLTVMPFSTLPAECGKKCLRVLINKEVVGDFKYAKRKSDIIVQSDCDEAAGVIADMLGWRDMLDDLYEKAKAELKEQKTETAEDKAEEVAAGIKEAEKPSKATTKDENEEPTKEERTHPQSKEEDFNEETISKKLGKLSL
ncbi:Sir2 histone deacetylase Hst2 [Candidozyma auris]|nr:hypothetical protein QG37_04310 [[Candida] auris]